MEKAHTAPEPKANPNPNPNPSSMWSSIVKSEPAPKPASLHSPGLAVHAAVGSCRSAKGIMMAVVDANAIIEGGQNLLTFADKFVTVPEVLSEIRDPVSRHRLSIVPFSIESIEPSTESLNKVIKFARATGDLQTLSDVDLKLIALTYTLEAQIHGTKQLREVPPPIHTVNVRRLPEKELPGWGSNVPNLEEWEALDNETEDNANNSSRILPLKDLNLNTIPSEDHSENGSFATKGSDSVLEHENEEDPDVRRHRRYPPKKKEINIEGKMVAEGIDASQGHHEDDADDWRPAVSRSTHRRFLRRKSRREYYDALAEKESQQNQEKSEDDMMDNSSGKGKQSNPSPEVKHVKNEVSVEKNDDVDISSILKQMRLEEDSFKALQDAGVEEEDSLRALQDAGVDKLSAETSLVDGNDVSDNHIDVEVNEIKEENEALDALEISSAATETVETSIADDASSEQSWMLRSLSESNIACITGDYAMQNVLLQMGLRLLAPGGMQIRQLHRWVLKCHACYTVTAEIGRIFCPKCGNGGTLRKVAVTVGENGVVIAARRPRITLRGTKFSIPLPQGGRDAITKNPILREDQLPQKFLYPKTKKKTNKQGEVFYAADDTFTQHTDKKAPLRPPVRKALAVFSQKRNPNDNHYSRSLH